MQNNHWSLLARRDLGRVHEVILSVHPGVLESGDAAFQQWVDRGYRLAMDLAERADSSEKALAAVRYYLVGFRDGHLGVVSDASSARAAQWAGWTVQRRNGEFRVVYRAESWDGELPPVGAKLIGCDDQEVLPFLAERVAPFVDMRMGLEATLSQLAVHLSNKWPRAALWGDASPSSCRFEVANGNNQRFSLRWRESNDGLRALYRPRPAQGIQQWGDGRYWVHASNFMPQSQDIDGLHKLLGDIRKLPSADVVVLDTRGNTGGNSEVGRQLLRALLKEAFPSAKSEAKAYWRVSPLAISTLESSLRQARNLEGEDNVKYRFLESMLTAMRTAASDKQTYVEQDDTILETAPAETGPPFGGRLILITDSNCASACLDFVDMVLAVPGAVHVGLPTSADSPYIDVATLALPSGLRMWIPMKVWRNRERGNNEPRIPRIVYSGDIGDTSALRAWVASRVLPLALPIAK